MGDPPCFLHSTLTITPDLRWAFLWLLIFCALFPRAPSTHVDDVGQVMDVVLEDRGIGGLQSQQVLIPGFKSLQFVL